MSLPPNLDLSRFVNNVKGTPAGCVRYQQQIGTARRQSAATRLSQAGVLVPGVLHYLLWWRTLSVNKQYVEQQSAVAIA
jgi:hypothetical protein